MENDSRQITKRKDEKIYEKKLDVPLTVQQNSLCGLPNNTELLGIIDYRCCSRRRQCIRNHADKRTERLGGLDGEVGREPIHVGG